MLKYPTEFSLIKKQHPTTSPTTSAVQLLFFHSFILQHKCFAFYVPFFLFFLIVSITKPSGNYFKHTLNRPMEFIMQTQDMHYMHSSS